MKMNNVDTKQITTRVKSIEQRKFIAKAGQETIIVLVRTEDGIFTNFLNIWERQHIDLNMLEEGDLLDITYTTFFNTEKNHEYKNFISIKKVIETEQERVDRLLKDFN